MFDSMPPTEQQWVANGALFTLPMRASCGAICSFVEAIDHASECTLFRLGIAAWQKFANGAFVRGVAFVGDSGAGQGGVKRTRIQQSCWPTLEATPHSIISSKESWLA